MNDRLEIASRFGAGYLARTESTIEKQEQVAVWALEYADALIALEAETRKDEIVGKSATPAEIDIHIQGIEHGKQIGISKGHAQAIEQVKNAINSIPTLGLWSDPAISINSLICGLSALKPEVE